MEDNSDLVVKFTQQLCENSAKNKTSLYRDQKVGQTGKNFTLKDVFSHVASSLKAIQNADCEKPSPAAPRNNLVKWKKSMFCSVSQLSVEEHQNKPANNKFETQFVSDTELIDIIEGAEAKMNTNKDKKHTEDINSIVQHENPLAHNEITERYCPVNNKKTIKDTNNSCDISNKKYNNKQNKNSYNDNKDSNKEIELEIKQLSESDIFSEEEIIENEIKIKQMKDENLTQILNESVECEKELCDLGVIIERDDIISSPIIKVKETKRYRSPLVFDLQSFENFEKRILPDLALNRNIDDDDVLTFEANKVSEYEPILNVYNKENLRINTENITMFDAYKKLSADPSDKANYFISDDSKRSLTPNMLLCHERLPAITQNSNISQNMLKDEILFSSDEEDNLNLINELPFTCALETSFYTNQSQVLDKTMFVAFQTASNKSIQINTDSFDRAKSIFNNTLQGNDCEEPTLEELVFKYDQNKIKYENYSSKAYLRKEGKGIHSQEFVTNNLNNYNSKNSFHEDYFRNQNEDIKNSEELLTDYKEEFNNINASPIVEAKILRDNESKALESQKDEEIKETDSCKSNEVHCESIHDDNNSNKYEGETLLKYEKNKEDIHVSEFETNTNAIIVQEIKNNSKNLDTKEFYDEEIEQLSPIILDSKSQVLSTSNVFQYDLNDKIIAQDETVKSEIVNTEISKYTNDAMKENSTEVVLPTNNHLEVKFKTSLGKNIQISRTTLKIAQKKVHDMTKDFDYSEIKDQFIGFKTASNKGIKITQEALMKSKQFLSDVCSESYSSSLNEQVIDDKVFSEQNIASKILTKNIKTKENDRPNIFKMPFPKKGKSQVVNTATVTKKSSNKVSVVKTIKNLASNFERSKSKEGMFKNDKDDYELSPTVPENTEFKGFTTASHKKIDISKEALNKTKHIFQDIEQIDTEITTTDKSVNSQTFIGFQTASNKKINISEEALLKTKAVFRDIDDFKENINENDAQNVFKGFQTASKKKIEVSNEALAKTKQFYNDIEGIDIIVTETNEQNSSKDFKGFKTASDKKIVISKDALASTCNIFKDIECFEDTSNINQYAGFKTASKKKIGISKDALAKTRDLFIDIEGIDNVVASSNCKENKSYQIANNQQATLSEDALLKSNIIYKRDDNFKKRTNEGFEGFKTASNKTIKVSDKAMAMTKLIFQDMEETDDVVTITNQKCDNKRDFTGFQTANNKSINISEDALVQTRDIFKEIDDFKENRNKIDTEYEFPIRGFQTAGNKKIEISKEALAKSKQLFQYIEENNDVLTKSKVFSGFQTANNKIINVSEEAKLKSKHLLQEFVEDTDNAESFKDAFSRGFQTTNKKNIEISDKALIKTRQLFKDYDKDRNSTFYNEFKNDKDHEFKNELELKPIKRVNEEIDLKNLLDTQVIDNLNNSLNTEDFCKETKTKKRSSSPILACPSAKRKCFKTPYNLTIKQKIVDDVVIKHVENHSKINTDYKKIKKYSLKDLINMEKEDGKNVDSEIDPYILTFDYDALLNFEFKGERNNLTKEGSISITEIKDNFIKTIPNQKLIPENWLDIQLRLILWKLISYEVIFPNVMHRVCNSKNVIEQLTYRYTKELYNVERPILRKILEKDELSSRTMILCVVKIEHNSGSAENPELLLTDGWYTIKASIDRMLARMVVANKIFVGCKLACNGAELTNCEQGVAPWEDTSLIRLKLFGNSTRLAKWDVKLGLHRNTTINTGLRAVHIDGGRISKTTVFVTRVYPMLYVEKFDDGSTVTRSERLEIQHQMKYETERDALMEKLYEQVEKEIELDSQDSNSDSGKRKCLDSGSQIAKMMRKSTDPTQFRATLTASQNRLLDDHSAKIRDNLLKTIETRVQDRLVRRNVVGLLKIRVVFVQEDTMEVVKGVLSIWRPNELLFEIIKESAWLDILNITPTAERYGEIQLTAGRQTTYREPKKKINEKLISRTKPLLRTCHTIKYIVQNPSFRPDYNEIDTIGLIFAIEPTNVDFDKEKNKNNFQNVYLADAYKNFLCINFWGGIKKFGYESILDTGQIVAGINLQRRAGNTRKNIPQYRATEYTYFTKTPKNQPTKDLLEECSKKINSIDRRKFCNDCLDLKNNYSLCKVDSPYKLNNSDISINRQNNSSLASKVSTNDIDLNLTGLDFESTFRQKDTQDLSPKLLQRKKQVNEKIARLKNYYGEPPPLSPIHILNQSKQATNAYKSPMLTADLNKSHTSVARYRTPVKERASSPILNSNIKRNNINNAKLNLVNKINSEDQFIGEFDASPPLSLD